MASNVSPSKAPASAAAPASSMQEAERAAASELPTSMSPYSNIVPATEAPKEELEDWEIQRERHKAVADGHFRSKSYPEAIQSYTAALSLDPKHHLLLSNRSAAYLANGEKSRALADARECVQIKPDFAKGWNRVAAAMMSLGRYGEARGVYAKVLGMEKSNAVAKKGLDDCARMEREVKQREVERMKWEMERKKRDDESRLKDAAMNAEEGKKEAAAEKRQENIKEKDKVDDLLDDFFSEVEEVTAKTKTTPPSDPLPAEESSTQKKISIHLSDLGTPESQIVRLLAPNYEYRNLNPFYVLSIPHNSPDEIIQRRYKALSLLVHPDKCSDERSKAAFDEVRKAMALLGDEDKKRHVVQLVERGLKNGKRDHDAAQLTRKGLVNKTEAEEQLRQCQERATMKIFAEIEHRRREVEKRKRSQEQRERAQEDEILNKEKKSREFEKRWKESDRVEKRIGNWRDFQSGGSTSVGQNGDGKKKKSRWG